MTKESKSILEKDLKKYKTLVNYADKENREVYLKIANYIASILEKE